MRVFYVSTSIAMLACGLSAAVGCRAPVTPRPAVNERESSAQAEATPPAVAPGAAARQTEPAEKARADAATRSGERPATGSPVAKTPTGAKPGAEKSAAAKPSAGPSADAKSSAGKPAVAGDVAAAIAPAPAPAVKPRPPAPIPATAAGPVAPSPAPTDDTAAAPTDQAAAPSTANPPAGGWNQFLGRRQDAVEPPLLECPDPCHDLVELPPCPRPVPSIQLPATQPVGDTPRREDGRPSAVGSVREFFGSIPKFKPAWRRLPPAGHEPDCAAAAHRAGGWFADAEGEPRPGWLFAAFGRSVHR